MPITFNCPQCHRTYRVIDTHAGRSARCKTCQAPMVVPAIAVPPVVVEASPSPAPVVRHQAPTEQPKVVTAATPFLPQISSHIARTVGPSPKVFHEVVSTAVHIDLHIVPPTNQPPSEDHPLGTYHWTVVTSGMSSRPMNVPPTYTGPKFIELMIALPPDWPGLRPDGTFDTELMKDERNWWPFRWLKHTARLPVLFNTYLGLWHTIPNGEQARPFAENTDLSCLMICPPLMSPKAFKLVANDNATIYFFALAVLYREEMQLKMAKGVKALTDLMDRAKVKELVQVGRKNLATGG